MQVYTILANWNKKNEFSEQLKIYNERHIISLKKIQPYKLKNATKPHTKLNIAWKRLCDNYDFGPHSQFLTKIMILFEKKS